QKQRAMPWSTGGAANYSSPAYNWRTSSAWTFWLSIGAPEFSMYPGLCRTVSPAAILLEQAWERYAVSPAALTCLPTRAGLPFLRKLLKSLVRLGEVWT